MYQRKNTALKEIVDRNFEELTVNHRSDDSVLELYPKVKELTAANFSNSTNTKQHLCFTNAKRIQVNHLMMERDKKKKKKMLLIPKNELNPKSQTVRLIIGAPVMCIWNRKSLGLINGATFTVKSLEPLILKDTFTKQLKTITTKDFQMYFYINYCTTVYKVQGDSIGSPFTIWEWKRMDERMRYTAISRTTKKEFINIAEEEEEEELGINMEEDVDIDKLKNNKQRRKQLSDPLRRKRFNAMTILYRIIKGCSSDAYSLEHTSLSRQDLLNHLKIPNGDIPIGYQIDHIRARHTFETDEDFKFINHFSNLRLLPKFDNISRNIKE